MCCYLRKKNYNAEIIDFRSRDFEQYKLFKMKLYHKYPMAAITDILRLKRNLRRRKNYHYFWRKFFILSSKRYTEKDCLKNLNNLYDAFVCGSDQIWNPNCTHGVVGAFFLDFASKWKFAYAPSIAEKNINEKDWSEMLQLIRRLDAVSVREKNSAEMLQKDLGKKVSCVLDPTLLLEKDDYKKMIDPLPTDKYVFVYVLEENEEIYHYADKLALEKKMKIKYFSKTNKKFSVKSTNYYLEGPQYFLNNLAKADYVISNSFHATVFSVIFEKQFITYPTKASSSRMVDFLESLGIRDRMYNGQNLMDDPIDFRMVNCNLNKLKLASEKYLDDALKKLE